MALHRKSQVLFQTCLRKLRHRHVLEFPKNSSLINKNFGIFCCLSELIQFPFGAFLMIYQHIRLFAFSVKSLCLNLKPSF